MDGLMEYPCNRKNEPLMHVSSLRHQGHSHLLMAIHLNVHVQLVNLVQVYNSIESIFHVTSTNLSLTGYPPSPPQQLLPEEAFGRPVSLHAHSGSDAECYPAVGSSKNRNTI